MMINSEPIPILSLIYAHRVNTKLIIFGLEETVNLNLWVSTTLVELKPFIEKLTGSPRKLRQLTNEADTQESMHYIKEPASDQWLHPRTHQVLQVATTL